MWDVRGVRELDHRGADHPQIGRQHTTGEAEHVGPLGQRAVVAMSTLRRQQGSADDRCRVRRVIGECRRARPFGSRAVCQRPARLEVKHVR